MLRQQQRKNRRNLPIDSLPLSIRNKLLRIRQCRAKSRIHVRTKRSYEITLSQPFISVNVCIHRSTVPIHRAVWRPHSVTDGHCNRIVIIGIHILPVVQFEEEPLKLKLFNVPLFVPACRLTLCWRSYLR